jgi:hypothetical protein
MLAADSGRQALKTTVNETMNERTLQYLINLPDRFMYDVSLLRKEGLYVVGTYEFPYSFPFHYNPKL